MKSKTLPPYPPPEQRDFSPLAIWRLFFAVGYQRPRSWVERRQLRLRATFFLVLGCVLTLLVQAALGRFGLCPK